MSSKISTAVDKENAVPLILRIRQMQTNIWLNSGKTSLHEIIFWLLPANYNKLTNQPCSHVLLVITGFATIEYDLFHWLIWSTWHAL